MSQYIGKTISLISNKGVRYVGLLYNISAEDATVALQSVRSFGTEGRMAEQGQPNLEVLPGSDVYDYVTFRGSDVKDLSVLDIPLDQVQPVSYQPPTLGLAPAPTATSQVPTQRQSSQPQHVPATTTDANSESANTLTAAPAAAAVPTQPEPTSTFTAADAPTQGSPATQTATKTIGDQPTKTQAVPNAAPGSVPQPITKAAQNSNDGDFDFESANARFQKEGKDELPAAPVYNKSTSFFDSISLNEHGNMRWSEEKNLNMDTFGESSVRRGRGNWRGRGRGRGNWRGRGGQKGRGKPESKPEWA